MRGRLIQLFIKIAVLTAVVWVARRGLMRWVNGPEAVPSSEPWPPLGAPAESLGSLELGAELPRPAVARAPNPTPVEEATDAGEPAPTVPPAGRPVTELSSPPSQITSIPPPAEVRQESAWLPPDASGSCPSSHPVKAKRSTRLYREPGTAAYDRAKPDRCYASAAAAEADGFTRAKR